MPDMTDQQDFYEDDESPADVAARFEAGQKGLTRPQMGWNRTLDVQRPGPYLGSSANETARAS